MINKIVERRKSKLLKIAITKAVPSITTEHCNTIATSITGSRWSTNNARYILNMLSKVDSAQSCLSSKDIQLTKLMIIYHKINHDPSLSINENIRGNAQSALLDLYSYELLSDNCATLVQVGILSTINRHVYLTEKEKVAAVDFFLDIHRFFNKPTLRHHIRYSMTYVAKLIKITYEKHS